MCDKKEIYDEIANSGVLDLDTSQIIADYVGETRWVMYIFKKPNKVHIISVSKDVDDGYYHLTNFLKDEGVTPFNASILLGKLRYPLCEYKLANDEHSGFVCDANELCDDAKINRDEKSKTNVVYYNFSVENEEWLSNIRYEELDTHQLEKLENYKMAIEDNLEELMEIRFISNNPDLYDSSMVDLFRKKAIARDYTMW